MSVDEMAALLDLDEKAKRFGKSGLPGPDEKQLDGPQSEVIQFIKGGVQQTLTQFVVRLGGLNDRIQRRSLDGLSDRLESLGETFVEEIRDLRSGYLPRIDRAHDTYTKCRERYIKFRADNGLDRDPVIPESFAWKFGIIAGVTIAEAVLNALFFQIGLEYGLVQGILYALTLAVVDIVTVSLLGRAATRVVSIKPAEKVFGSFILLVLIVWIGVYNLAIAHVREAIQIQIDVAEAGRIALQTLSQDPFGLEQIQSWFLFAFALGLSVTAAVQAFNWTEKYPGFLSAWTSWKESLEDFEYLQVQLGRGLAKLADDTLRRVDEVVREAETIVGDLKQTIETKDIHLNGVSQFVSFSRTSLDALLQRYRSLNREVRGQTPEPGYFNSKVEIDFDELPGGSTTADQHKLKTEVSRLKSITNRAVEVRARIRAVYDDEIEELTSRFSAITPDVLEISSSDG